MTIPPESIARALSAAYAEALRVGDSPLRADQLAVKLAKLQQDIPQLDAADDIRQRIQAALSRAEQTLRRDDDGKQAARHLKEAVQLAEAKQEEPRKAPWE